MGPGVFGFDPDQKPYPYDPDRAKQLLAAAGYPNGFETKLTYRTDGEIASEAEIVQALVADLGKVGVKVTLEPIEFNTYSDRYTIKMVTDVDMFAHSNANNDADANYNLTANVYSEGRGKGRTGYYWPTPKDVDDAIVKGRSITDEGERANFYHTILKRIYDEAPMIFMFDKADTYAVSKRIQGVKPQADETVLLHTASLSG